MDESLLAIDPGLNNPAAAMFRHGVLVAASRVKPDKKWNDLVVGERCRLVARRLSEWAYDHGLDASTMRAAREAELAGRHAEARTLRQDRGIVILAVEWPQVYTRSKSKGDPNDLLPLAGVAMCLAGHLDVEVRSYRPAEWIGQCPKKETGDPLVSPRGQLVWRHLSTKERATVLVSHDSIDAIGIGLFALGRLRMHVYPGAT